jgi:predicted Zn-dependent peptidase
MTVEPQGAKAVMTTSEARRPSRSAADEPEAVVRTLPNGLRVATTPLPHLGLASATLFVRVGSRYEEVATNGLSHLVEHVLFRGCEAYPDTYQLNAAIESVGSALDAATMPDFTTFDAVCLPERLPELLGLMGAMIGKPLFAGVDVEQRIITEELQDEIDARGRDIDPDNLSKMRFFPGSSMGLKVGGTLASIKRFDEADCRRWHGEHYVAANMVLSVAGPVTVEAVMEAALESFGALPTGELKAPRAATSRADLPAFEFTQNTGTQCDLHLTWVVPVEAHEDWPALQLSQRVLDDGICSRLRHRLVDQLGLAYYAGADLEVYEGVSIFTIATQTRHGQAVAAVDAILEVLGELQGTPPPEEAVRRMKARMELEAAVLRDSVSQTSYWQGLRALQPGIGSLAERWRRASAVTPEAIAVAARAHFDRKRVQLTAVGDLDPMQRAALRHRVRAQGR